MVLGGDSGRYNVEPDKISPMRVRTRTHTNHPGPMGRGATLLRWFDALESASSDFSLHRTVTGCQRRLDGARRSPLEAAVGGSDFEPGRRRSLRCGYT